MDVIELMKKEMLRRGYSLRSIKSYVDCLKKFQRYCYKEPRKITKNDVRAYLDALIERNKSGSTINVHLNAIKFLMEEVLNKRFMVRIKYSKTPKTLPTVLTKEEVIRLINSIDNEKHRLMIKLMYGAGLRVSELVNLRFEDLDRDNNYGWVRHGKGNKDRLFIIPESLKEDLLTLINQSLNQDSWVFKTYNGHISARSVQAIVKKASKKAQINKRVTPHTFRHSYATHLIENGYDITAVQALLGHNKPTTTMVYVHIVSPRLLSVKSPLDSLRIKTKENKNLQLMKDYNKTIYEFKENEDVGLINKEIHNLRI